MRIDLCPERSGGIDENLVFNHSAALHVADLRTALVQGAHWNRPPGAVSGSNPVYVLGKVAHLIQRVPNRKLKFALRRTFRQHYLHLHQMLLGIRQRNCVVGGCARTSQPKAKKKGEGNNPALEDSWQTKPLHLLPAAFAAFPIASAARARRRAGSFS